MRVSAVSLAVSILSIAFFTSPVCAHGSSTTGIDVKMDGASLVLTLRLNQADLIEHVLGEPDGTGRFVDRQQYEDAAARVLSYVIGHLRLSADGKDLAPPGASDWPVQHVELTHVDSHGAEVSSRIPLTLRYALPDRAGRIEFRPRLYATPRFSPLFLVTLYPGGGRKPEILDPTQMFQFEMPATESRHDSHEKHPAGHHVTNNRNLTIGIFVPIVLIFIIAMRRWKKRR